MKNLLVMCAAATGVGFLGMQFLPVGGQLNPAVDNAHTIEAEMAPPVHVQQILNRACKTCHSDATAWPWYSRIAPMSLMIGKDVFNARKTMNFSKWSVQAGLSERSEMGLLTAACADVQADRMPLPRYVMLHPEAKLSAEEKKAFCAWSTQETKRLARQIREKAASAHSTTKVDSTKSPSI